MGPPELPQLIFDLSGTVRIPGTSLTPDHVSPDQRQITIHPEEVLIKARWFEESIDHGVAIGALSPEEALLPADIQVLVTVAAFEVATGALIASRYIPNQSPEFILYQEAIIQTARDLWDGLITPPMNQAI